MMKAVIHTELSPIVGTEKQSEDLVQSLLKDFEDDPVRLWESNIFGKSLHELVNDGLQNKLLHMPQEARGPFAGDAGTGHQRGLYRTHLYLDLTKSPLHETNVQRTFMLFLFFGQFGNEHLINLIALQNELPFLPSQRSAGRECRCPDRTARCPEPSPDSAQSNGRRPFR